MLVPDRSLTDNSNILDFGPTISLWGWAEVVERQDGLCVSGDPDSPVTMG